MKWPNSLGEIDVQQHAKDLVEAIATEPKYLIGFLMICWAILHHLL